MGASRQNGKSDTRQVPELPDLVWHLILRLLLDTSRPTVCHVAASSRRLYMLAVPVLYKKVELGRQERSQKLVGRLAKDSTSLTHFIQEIDITLGDWGDAALQQLPRIFSATTQLRTLKWSGSYGIPDEILNGIHRSSPGARIIMNGQISHSSQWTASAWPNGGVSSPNLYSLYASMPANPLGAHEAKLAVYRTLRSSSNLRKLEMFQQSGGCVVYGYDPELEAELDVQAGEQLPHLEELSYPMFANRDLALWGEMGGWSRLRTLKLSGCIYKLESFVGRVPRLRSLTLECSWDELKESEQHITQITGLEELILSGHKMQFPFELLASNADTLTTLRVHSPEPYNPKRRPDIPRPTLQRLSETCPKLRSLAVDINRDGKWPFKYLAQLARFPKLTHLTLFAEGTRGTGTPVLPKLVEASCVTIFKHLLANKTGPLRHLTVERGGMEAWGGGYPGWGVMQEAEYRATFEYAVDGHGVISGGMVDGHTMRRERSMAQNTSMFSSDIYQDPPADLTEAELSFLATRLDRAWAEDVLGSKGLLCETGDDVEVIVPDVERREAIVKLAGTFTGFDEDARERYMKKTERVLREKRLSEAVDRMFTKDCTLYDIYKRGEVMRSG